MYLSDEPVYFNESECKAQFIVHALVPFTDTRHRLFHPDGNSRSFHPDGNSHSFHPDGNFSLIPPGRGFSLIPPGRGILTHLHPDGNSTRQTIHLLRILRNRRLSPNGRGGRFTFSG